MAKHLKEQTRLWGNSARDPTQFGDGAPLHSHIVFDLPRMLNNLQTYCEPGFGFLYSSTVNADGTPATEPNGAGTGYVVASAGGGDGSALLGMAPILVRPDCERVCVSMGFYRSTPGENPIEMDLISVSLYLASAPCNHLHDPAGSGSPGNGRLFSPSFIPGPYTSHTIAVPVGGQTDTPNPCYVRIEDTAWTDAFPRGCNNVNDRNGDAWSILHVVGNFTGAVTGDALRVAETSIWFAYEPQ